MAIVTNARQVKNSKSWLLDSTMYMDGEGEESKVFYSCLHFFNASDTISDRLLSHLSAFVHLPARRMQ
jgi:hypothetical protein